MMKQHITILTQDLEKKFGDFTAVDGVSFSVSKGEIFGFLGPNGSGKTTTIRMMLGLLEPNQGAIQVLGAPIPDQIQSILPRIGYMSQQFSLYNDLTVYQNLKFYGQAYGLQSTGMEKRIQEALKLSSLEGYQDTRTSDLSGGWRQRLALSAAILHQPEVLFLDEPTAGVDPVSRRAFWDLLYQLVAGGITVFITTHYMDEAEHCHRLAFIQQGRIITQGTPSSIKQQSFPGTVLELQIDEPERMVRAIEQEKLAGRLADLEAELFGPLIHITTNDPHAHRRALRALSRSSNLKLQQITEIEPSLEDVFIARMQGRSSGGDHEN